MWQVLQHQSTLRPRSRLRTPWTPTSVRGRPPPPPPPAPPPPLVLFPQRLGEFPDGSSRHAPVPPTARTPPVRSKMPKRVRSRDAPPVLARSCRPRISPARRLWPRWATAAARPCVEEPLQHTERLPWQRHAVGRASRWWAGLHQHGRGEDPRINGRHRRRHPGVQLVAQAKGTNTTSISSNALAGDESKRTGAAVLCRRHRPLGRNTACSMAASVWSGRRESFNPFLMSSGLLPPSSPSMRFGVDNAKLGDIRTQLSIHRT